MWQHGFIPIVQWGKEIIIKQWNNDEFISLSSVKFLHIFIVQAVWLEPLLCFPPTCPGKWEIWEICCLLRDSFVCLATPVQNITCVPLGTAILTQRHWIILTVERKLLCNLSRKGQCKDKLNTSLRPSLWKAACLHVELWLKWSVHRLLLDWNLSNLT